MPGDGGGCLRGLREILLLGAWQQGARLVGASRALRRLLRLFDHTYAAGLPSRSAPAPDHAADRLAGRGYRDLESTPYPGDPENPGTQTELNVTRRHDLKTQKAAPPG